MGLDLRKIFLTCKEQKVVNIIFLFLFLEIIGKRNIILFSILEKMRRIVFDLTWIVSTTHYIALYANTMYSMTL